MQPVMPVEITKTESFVTIFFFFFFFFFLSLAGKILVFDMVGYVHEFYLLEYH